MRHVCEVKGCRNWKGTKPLEFDISNDGCSRQVGKYARKIWLCPSHSKELARPRTRVWASSGNMDINSSTAGNWSTSGATANTFR